MSVAGERSDRARIVIVGAGPAGVMLLERIVANHARDTPGLGIDVHLVDPHEPGGGRIWRRDQSPLLKLNSMLRDVTVFTDDSCVIDGPIAPGPSLAEWVEVVRDGAIERPDWSDAALDAEIAGIGPADFPTRRLNNAYLSWAYAEIVRRSAAALTVTWHRDTATGIEDVSGEGAARRVRLASGRELPADLVVHAVGHTGSAPSADAIRLAAFANRHALVYLPPSFTADLDLDALPPGEAVIVRGMGLAAVDLVVRLTEGRGGRFERDVGGALRYAPSGGEPLLHLGSGRGVPYRSKITSRMVGEAQRLEYLGSAFHEALARRSEPLDFARDVWPLISAEMLTGYYRELFTGHPDRVVGEWAEFSEELRRILAVPGGAESEELLELVRSRVPQPDDRFDLASFDRPLAAPDPEPRFGGGAGARVDGGAGARVDGRAGTRVGGGAGVGSDARLVHDRVRAHIAADLRQRTTQRHSATQALFMTVLFSYLSLSEVPAEAWNARSRTDALPRRWHRYFSYLASGPPGHRLEELIALADAGVVRFLGGGLVLEAREDEGVFAATGSVRTGRGSARSGVSARVLIDAWLPEAQARRSDNAYLRRLVERGEARELSVADAEYDGSTGQIEVDEIGRVAGGAAQYAVGPFTSLPTGGAFTRPKLNSLPFRVHDRVARGLLADAEIVVGERSAEGSLVGSRGPVRG